jgi:hypothetical protein
VTCDMWVRALAALPRAPATWDDGVDVVLLCHLLFLLLQVRENHRLENVPRFPIRDRSQRGRVRSCPLKRKYPVAELLEVRSCVVSMTMSNDDYTKLHDATASTRRPRTGPTHCRRTPGSALHKPRSKRCAVRADAVTVLVTHCHYSLPQYPHLFSERTLRSQV